MNSSTDVTPASALGTWAQLKAGEKVVVSDYTLDWLDAYFKEHDGTDADLYFGRVASIPNPKRVGIRDQYIAWVKP